MLPYVETTFGPWDDALQRERFVGDFAASIHEVIVVDGVDAGLWSLDREVGRFFLRKVYLLPEFQRRGIGSTLLRGLVEEAKISRLPIELRHLIVNPVASLYGRLGFERQRVDPPYVYLRKAL
jgi:Acetyltransferases